MCEISDEVIVVMDSSKIDQRGMHVIRPFAEITTLVTDSGLPKEYVEALASTGVKLCIVKA
jgi:DeoR family transcriptional regulator of aga operon